MTEVLGWPLMTLLPRKTRVGELLTVTHVTLIVAELLRIG